MLSKLSHDRDLSLRGRGLDQALGDIATKVELRDVCQASALASIEGLKDPMGAETLHSDDLVVLGVLVMLC